jgi:hypothetical protein
MKILLLRGGMGNQLFIYGAYNFFKNKDKYVFLDDVYSFQNDFIFKRTNCIRRLKLKYNRLDFNIGLTWKLLGLLGDNISFLYFSNEYYQEAKYLDNINFSFSNTTERICIHIRLKDYTLKLNENEYIDMLNFVIKKKSNLQVFFISDDEFQFKSKMPNLYARGFFLNLSDIDCFNFIAESSEVILSDSSFSFCAAYLGNAKNIYFKRLTNIINNGNKPHKWINL